MKYDVSGVVAPVFFSKFDEWLKITKSIEATTLLSRLQFHCKNSVIRRDGKIWFTRTLDTFSSWLGISTKKISSLLASLESCNLITRTYYKYQGIRQTHISVQQCDVGYVNFEHIHQLANLCGGIKDAVILSRLYYFSKHSKLEFNGKRWAARSVQDIAIWSHLSKRQVSRILDNLIRKGLLFKRVSHFNGKPLSHFSVNFSLIERVLSGSCGQANKNDIQHVENTGGCLFGKNQVAKKAVPYNKKIKKLKYTNNNTRGGLDNKISKSTDRLVCDINFSKRDLAYLQGALDNLIHRDGIRVSNPKELLAQMEYALTQQISKFNLSFAHGVNRLCAIVRSGNWSTPYGFYSHSPEGRWFKADSEAQEKQWQQQKQEECSGGSMTQLEAMAATDNKTGSQDTRSGSVDNMNQEVGLIGAVAGKLQRCTQRQGGGALMGKLVSTLNLSARSARECPSVLTQKAIALAQQLKCLNTKIKQLTIKGSRDEQHILLSLADKLLARIKDLLTQGANAVSVQAVLAES